MDFCFKSLNPCIIEELTTFMYECTPNRDWGANVKIEFSRLPAFPPALSHRCDHSPRPAVVAGSTTIDERKERKSLGDFLPSLSPRSGSIRALLTPVSALLVH